MRSGQFFRSLLPALCVGLVFFSCGGDTPDSPTCDGDCQTPPAAVCEGDRAISFSLFGECTNGQCVYPPVIADCAADGGTCVAGACVAPPDPCDDVVCNEPPAANCDGDTLNQYAADSGECVDGGCTYEVQQTDCAARRQVCQDGACVTPVNLCAGILCEEPPADGCDGESAVTYVEEGECNPEDGECVYAEVTRRDCAAEGLFCNNARCQAENPCAGITCNTPPENFCNENDNAVVYVARGTCSGGECSYLESVRDCDNATEVCEDGACRDRLPCDGVVCNRPPAATCRGTLLNFYEPLGSCADGRCSYTLRSQDCATTNQNCEVGACVDRDACFGVVCNTIPPTTCRGNTVVSYRAGSCQLPGGTCSYPEVTLDCAATGRTCIDGACEITDPCAGVTCLTPPAPECLDGVAVEYLNPGTCNADTGLCEYDAALDDCAAVPGFTCSAGVCEFVDPCATSECEPPPSFCDGEVAVSYTDGGVCLPDGSCDTTLSEVREDCAESGSTCFEGVCRGPGAFISAETIWITEFYPGDDIARRTPWLELRNTSVEPLDIGGLQIGSGADGSLIWTVPQDTTIPGFAYIVAAPRGYVIDGVDVDVTWEPGEVVIPESGGVLRVFNVDSDGVSISYDPSFGYSANESVQLDPGINLGDFGAATSWCVSEQTPQSTRTLSPGIANHACASRWVPGQITVTELMPIGNALPLLGAERWFELYNPSTTTIVNLEGLVVEFDSGASFLIDQAAPVAPQSYFVIAFQTANLPGRSNFGSNQVVFGTEDAITISTPAREVTRLAWTTAIGFSTGSSAQFSGTGAPSSPAIASEWCAAGVTYGGFTPNLGTPSAATICPP